MATMNRSLVWSILVLLLLSSGCAKNLVDGTEDVASPDDSARQKSMSMPASGQGQAPAQTIVTQFDAKNIYFEFDKHALSAESRQTLTDIAAYLKENTDVRLMIEGHCDERGTNEYNLALGDRRANAARDFLITLGVDPVRIETISYGEEKPEDPRKTEEVWAKNRRDQFVFSR